MEAAAMRSVWRRILFAMGKLKNKGKKAAVAMKVMKKAMKRPAREGSSEKAMKAMKKARKWRWELLSCLYFEVS